MARRKKSRARHKSSQRRVLTTSNTREPASLHLNSIEDLRSYSPSPTRPLLSIMANPISILPKANFKKYSPPVTFHIPKEAVMCVRRKIRKEVIFAKGRGGRKNSRPRYNQNSKLRCK